MTIGRILGIMLFIGGGIFLLIGWIATGSLIEQASYALSGRYSNSTMAYLIGGGAAAALGFMMVIFARRRR